MEKVRCLIIGSGPAGYTAAIYAARANLSPVLYEGSMPGGQLTTTTEIENFPGYPDGISGPQMMEDLRKQAIRFGADVRVGLATKALLAPNNSIVTIDGETEIQATTVIISTGASAKYLGLPDEKKYAGLGVSACATCDGFFYRKKTVVVVGGGDTACEDAMYLSAICSKVYLAVRKDCLRASKVMQERVLRNEKIEILFKHEVIGLVGEDGVSGAILKKNRGEQDEEVYQIDVDGMFLAIGHHPNTNLFKGSVDLDETGYIKTYNGTQATNIPSVFAAGDVADPRYRQAITAAASGCRAAIDCEHYLIENGL
ncbi:MAG: thioredoxin-disulfide reductase [Paludibacteraceae bacterium]|nr:thioredoxin-disulfide reductase [Paludibacteraceae bacterium]